MTSKENNQMKLAETTVAISLASAALAVATAAPAASTSAVNTVHCTGINTCKGTSDCKTAENACKGQNVCKGHGFVVTTETECAKKGGKVSNAK